VSECLHKTVVRRYDNGSALWLWQCEWCGQQFGPTTERPNHMNSTVELKEPDQR
jgi:hypothetical protein